MIDGDLSENQYTFTGRQFDPESGLYHFHFRQYDAQAGVWTTPDPIGVLGGVNLYGYVHNNPVNKIDLLGLDEPGNGFGPDGTGYADTPDTSTDTSNVNLGDKDKYSLGGIDFDVNIPDFDPGQFDNNYGWQKIEGHWQYRYSPEDRDSSAYGIDTNSISSVPEVFHAVDPISWAVHFFTCYHELDDDGLPLGDQTEENKDSMRCNN